MRVLTELFKNTGGAVLTCEHRNEIPVPIQEKSALTTAECGNLGAWLVVLIIPHGSGDASLGGNHSD